MARKPTATPRTRKPAGVEPVAAAPEAAAASAQSETLSSDMDYAAHEATFTWFTGMVKWGIGLGFVLVIFLFIAIHPMIPPPAS